MRVSNPLLGVTQSPFLWMGIFTFACHVNRYNVRIPEILVIRH